MQFSIRTFGALVVSVSFVCTVATAEFDVVHAAKVVTGLVEPSL